MEESIIHKPISWDDKEGEKRYHDEKGRFLMQNKLSPGRYHGQTLAPIKEWCKLNQNIVIDVIRNILTSDDTPISIKWDCAKRVWEMMEGKPKESVQIESNGPMFAEKVLNLSKQDLLNEKQIIDDMLERKGIVIDGTGQESQNQSETKVKTKTKAQKKESKQQ